MQTEQMLIKYIADEIAWDQDGVTIAPDDQLLDGLLDSMDVLKLVVFVEGQFHVRVTDNELVPENFASIALLAAFIDSKGQPAASS